MVEGKYVVMKVSKTRLLWRKQGKKLCGRNKNDIFCRKRIFFIK